MVRQMAPEAPQIGLSPLFFARRGNRYHVVLTRVQCLRHAPDRAALASRVHALEHQHQRALAHRRVTHQQIQSTLQVHQTTLVGLEWQRTLVVKGAEQGPLIDGQWRHRCRQCRSGCLPGQPLAERVKQVLPSRQSAVSRIAAFDHQPWRLSGAGLAQSLLADFDKGIVMLEALPVMRCHAPGIPGVRFQCLESLVSCPLGQMKPELDQQRPLGHQHAFKLADIFQSLCETRGLLVPHDTRHDGLGVPRSKKNTDMSLGRQHLPEAPHGGHAVPVLGRVARCLGPDVTRIHPLVEQINGFTFAGAAHAVDQNDHREWG